MTGQPMRSAARLLRAGDRGWLVEPTPGVAAPGATVPGATVPGAASILASAIRTQPWFDLVADVVPASATVLVIARDTADMPVLARELAGLATTPLAATPTGTVRTVEIPVRYDGPDIAEVAGATGMSVREVTRTHAAGEYVVGFFGFAPGFAYIDGVPDELALPRRAEPRVRIEAGYVAIAGNQTVVYPGATPGGWHLIGRTDERLWDPDRVPPNRFGIGDRVVFRDLGA